MNKTRILILGGGFGGLYAALEFEKGRDPDFEVTLISQDNFFLFTPMLHEVAASDLDLTQYRQSHSQDAATCSLLRRRSSSC
jgi:NADH dehydrogenase FAD-containing subunit